MPKDLLKENAPVGKVVFEWWIKEYEQYERTSGWYMIMAIVGIVFMIYALVSQNYLFALIVVLIGIVLYMHEIEEPMEVYFAITETGVILGKKYYRFSELSRFWIIYNPPTVKNLYLGLDNLIKHRLRVPLLDYDPRPIRDYLAKFIKEDFAEEEEPLSDRFARLFKIH